jgi:hypothetical protein
MLQGGTLGWRWGPTPARTAGLRLSTGLAIACLLAASPGPTLAGYQGSVHSNWTAFNPCLGIVDSYPEKMRKEALAAFAGLGFATTSFTKNLFTKSKFLARTPADWAVYVHSHGDFYNNRPGFRADAGVCSGAIVSSADIAAKRPSTQQTNLVVMSTCHLGESVARNDMPLVYGVEKLKAGSTGWRGPEFYLGYVGTIWDSDQWDFESIFWDRLLAGASVGKAFDVAMATGSFNAGFDAEWWGSYTYLGWPGPYSSCAKCL